MRKLLPLTVIALAVGAATLQAQTQALQDIGIDDGAAPTTYTGSIGFEFSLSSDATLDSLGAFDFDTANSNGDSQQVGIFTLAGTELATATIAIPSGQAADTFVFTNSLTFMNGFTGTLSSGTDYLIGANGGGSGGIPYLNDTANTFTSGTALTVVKSAFSFDSGFTAPTALNNTGKAYIGPNFTYTAVPEPASYALVLAGLGALVGMLRLRRRNA
jgi:hypothetical protein